MATERSCAHTADILEEMHVSVLQLPGINFVVIFLAPEFRNDKNKTTKRYCGCGDVFLISTLTELFYCWYNLVTVRWTIVVFCVCLWFSHTTGMGDPPWMDPACIVVPGPTNLYFSHRVWIYPENTVSALFCLSLNAL